MKSRYVRFHGTRQEQLDGLRKQGWHVLKIKALPVVLAFKPNADGKEAVFVKGWHGDADKPAFFFHYRNMATAEDNTLHYLERVRVACEYKAGQKATRKAKRSALKASDHWAVGDVLYNSWGYEQTNIDWYQVVELKEKSIVIRAIKKNFAPTGHMQGVSQPRRSDFAGEPMLKPLDEEGRVSMRHGCGTKWDGSKVWESSYH